jgi:hypothetical protein
MGEGPARVPAPFSFVFWCLEITGNLIRHARLSALAKLKGVDGRTSPADDD